MTAAPPKTRAVYLTTIGGVQYLTAEFQREAGSTISYEGSPSLAAWSAPGAGGAPGVVETVSPVDNLTAIVRLNQPISAAGRYFLRAVGQNAIRRVVMDFDGDGRTDYAVVRSTAAGAGQPVNWFIAYSGGGTATILFGLNTDGFIPADYDRDGKSDVAVWRASTGQFVIQQSSDGTRTVVLGAAGDDPTVVADYDGDGKADPAVFRPAATPTGFPRLLYVGSLNNPAGAITELTLFRAGNAYFPAPGDYHGDGKADFCLQAGSGGVGTFYVLRSSDGGTESVAFGGAADRVVQGDFDGDTRSDFITTRGSAGTIQWRVLERDGGGTGTTPIVLGASATDFPVPGDYDGDGKMDLAMWKPSTGTFTVRRSSDGVLTTFAWGQSGDRPAANFQVH